MSKRNFIALVFKKGQVGLKRRIGPYNEQTMCYALDNEINEEKETFQVFEEKTNELERVDGYYRFKKPAPEKKKEELGSFEDFKKHEVTKIYEIQDDMDKKVAEVLLEQKGSCTHPVRVDCNDCPFSVDGCISPVAEVRLDALKQMGFEVN